MLYPCTLSVWNVMLSWNVSWCNRQKTKSQTLESAISWVNHLKTETQLSKTCKFISIITKSIIDHKISTLYDMRIRSSKLEGIYGTVASELKTHTRSYIFQTKHFSLPEMDVNSLCPDYDLQHHRCHLSFTGLGNGLLPTELLLDTDFSLMVPERHIWDTFY